MTIFLFEFSDDGILIPQIPFNSSLFLQLPRATIGVRISQGNIRPSTNGRDDIETTSPQGNERYRNHTKRYVSFIKRNPDMKNQTQQKTKTKLFNHEINCTRSTSIGSAEEPLIHNQQRFDSEWVERIG